MRVVISTNTAWNIANFRVGLIEALIQNGCDVIAIAPYDKHAERLKEIGCRFIHLPMDNKGVNPIADARLFVNYLRILKRELPDAFLGYTIKPNIYGSLAAQLCGIPVINNVSGLGTAFIRDTWLTKVVKNMYRVAFARSHTVFFQNEDDRQLFVENELVTSKRTRLLRGSGINLERFRPPDMAARASPDCCNFLLVARLVRDKGVGEYVEAARMLKSQRLTARCILLGFLDVENRTAVSRKEVEHWVREGVVEYMGAVDDVRSHIADADCVVLPSYREGAPRTLIEAAAMGKPLIATDVPGCRDVVEHGRNGLLCKVKDPGDLAAKMGQFLSMPALKRQAMGTAGRAKMEIEFDERLVIEPYIDILNSMSKTGLLSSKQRLA